MYLVNQRRPLVQLDDPLAVLAAISTCTKLYNFSNSVGLDKYLFSNLYKQNKQQFNITWVNNNTWDYTLFAGIIFTKLPAIIFLIWQYTFEATRIQNFQS